MNVAIVYDRITKFGGAERVLEALHTIWPDAPLFTAVYEPKGASWAKDFDIRTSFLQKIPFASRYHELLPWLTPLAFSSFSFDGFDVVISVTSAEAKGITVKPPTVHICYCLTPTRYLWSGLTEYQKRPGLGSLGNLASFGLRYIASILRKWDSIASRRPDHYVAISRLVKNRILEYYRTPVEAVIYPPIDTRAFVPPVKNQNDGYFLTVSRLVGYKRVDLLIDVFNTLGIALKIIGTGREKAGLQAKAKKNISFIDTHLTDAKLRTYYQRCSALIFAGFEDFGLVAAEAMACGKPVICFSESGMAEFVVDGKTGILFHEQTVESITSALERFKKMRYNSTVIRRRVLGLDQQVFAKQFEAFVLKKL